MLCDQRSNICIRWELLKKECWYEWMTIQSWKGQGNLKECRGGIDWGEDEGPSVQMVWSYATSNNRWAGARRRVVYHGEDIISLSTYATPYFLQIHSLPPFKFISPLIVFCRSSPSNSHAWNSFFTRHLNYLFVVLWSFVGFICKQMFGWEFWGVVIILNPSNNQDAAGGVGLS